MLYCEYKDVKILMPQLTHHYVPLNRQRKRFSFLNLLKLCFLLNSLIVLLYDVYLHMTYTYISIQVKCIFSPEIIILSYISVKSFIK